MKKPPRERPHRLPSGLYRGEQTVAFTCCVEGAQPLFRDDCVVAAFLPMLRTAAEQNGCRVLIYCFMPDHLHVLLDGQTGTADPLRAMREFKQRAGWWLRQNKPDCRWQKDFYDHIVRRDEDLGAQVRYIAGNPVRRELVSDWRQWPHTGAMGIELEAVIDGAITL
jgi:putative transposase